MSEDQPRSVEEGLRDVRRRHHPTKGGVATCDAFGESDQVGLEVVEVGCEPIANASEPGDDLVRDVKGAGGPNCFPDSAQILGTDRTNSPSPDNSFHENSGDPIGAGVIDRLFNGFGVVVRDQDHV